MIHCACLIHGDAYDWRYVHNLRRMLDRHLSDTVTLHVFTEPQRSVPSGYVRHDLEPWPGAAGPKRAWWNKLQLFRPGEFSGPVLYFDLDTVIIRDITWMTQAQPDLFWTLKDFRYLWRAAWQGINSSVMSWSAPDWTWIWEDVGRQDIQRLMESYTGDQDYLTRIIPRHRMGFFEDARFQSWRWQVWEGGLDFRTRQTRQPGRGAVVSPDTDVVIFHGRPKPHDVDDPWVHRHWAGQGI